jgi:cardiolipin synthase
MVAALLDIYLDLAPVFLIINIFLAIGIVFLERRNPTAALGWILLLFLIPVLGFVMYIIFGQNFYKKHIFRLKKEEDIFFQEIITKQKEELIRKVISLPDSRLEQFRPMITMLLENSMAYLTLDNSVGIFTSGEKKFSSLLSAIHSAKHHIHMEYYIIRKDLLGAEIIDALTKKAREGVEVRLLVDALGGRAWSPGMLKEFKAAGGQVARFFPSLIPFLNLRMNYRNHRKIVIIDGKTGYIGGFNIGEEYLGKGPLGPWRDTALKITGTSALALQVRFIMDWNYASKDDIEFAVVYFPESDPSGVVPIQIVSGGPDIRWNPIKESYLKLITLAQTSIYIQSPYFIPDESVLDALRIAALSGVDVRIIIPVKPDHPFVYWSSYSYIGDLLEAGVRAYTYDTGFIHAKTVVVDGLAASVGSANWDVRSFRLNFEANAVIYHPEYAGELHSIFLKDLDSCSEITPEKYRARPVWLKIKESVSRLFSPLL